MRASTFFRDPDHRMSERFAHERFLLDTYADRRAEATESRVTALARRLRRMMGGDLR